MIYKILIVKEENDEQVVLNETVLDEAHALQSLTDNRIEVVLSKNVEKEPVKPEADEEKDEKDNEDSEEE